MGSKHYILVGRTSKAIAGGILSQFGAGNDTSGNPVINGPGRVIQSRFGTFGDGEAIFELFVDGKLDDHPIEQRLSVEEKNIIFEDLKDADVTIVHSLSGENTSSRALSLASGARFLKKNGVRSIKLIAPHLPFMRNDREFQKEHKGTDGGITLIRQYNAVACEDYATALKFFGVDKVVGFEPHSRDGVKIYRTVFGEKNVEFINMGSFFADNIASEHKLVRKGECQIIGGSPDGMNKPKDFGMQRAYSFIEKLYEGTPFQAVASRHDLKQNPCMFGISKVRISSEKTEIIDFYGDVSGKTCVIIDDIISGGSTTLDAAKKLKEMGAAHVLAVATHAVLTDGALPKLLNSPHLDQVMLTDTIPGAIDKLDNLDHAAKSKLIIKTVSPLINDQIALNVPRNELKIAVTPPPTLQAG